MFLWLTSMSQKFPNFTGLTSVATFRYIFKNVHTEWELIPISPFFQENGLQMNST